MPDIETLATDWLRAKGEEAAANKRRVEIESQLVELIGKKDEGSKTQEVGNFKITTTGKVTRKMEWDKWELVKEQIPANLHPIKTKEELDEKGVKWLKENQPEFYNLLPITVTPAKTAIDIKVIAI